MTPHIAVKNEQNQRFFSHTIKTGNPDGTIYSLRNIPSELPVF